MEDAELTEDTNIIQSNLESERQCLDGMVRFEILSDTKVVSLNEEFYTYLEENNLYSVSTSYLIIFRKETRIENWIELECIILEKQRLIMMEKEVILLNFNHI